jgi:carboxypeptidase C (cathepsin A)
VFYVAYFKKGATPKVRPVTFLFSGGPGSSTVWLHMNAFGLEQVVTADNTHLPAASYAIVDNDSPLRELRALG